MISLADQKRRISRKVSAGRHKAPADFKVKGHRSKKGLQYLETVDADILQDLTITPKGMAPLPKRSSMPWRYPVRGRKDARP